MVVTPKVSRRTRKDGSSFTTTSTTSPDMVGDFVDLFRDTGESLLLPGAPLYWLRNRHGLYWSYNPRGNEDVTEDFRYCQFCKCPSHYCAEVMYGDICANHTEYLRVEMGSLVTVYDFYLRCAFTRTYTNLVHTKMMDEDKDHGMWWRSNYILPGKKKVLIGGWSTCLSGGLQMGTM